MSTFLAFVFCISTVIMVIGYDVRGEKIDKVKAEYASLLTKYEGTMCSVRGLTLTSVKGITLCMDPQTKALHKIDATAD